VQAEEQAGEHAEPQVAAVADGAPDGGCLQTWERAELPAPVPFGWGNIIKAIGPGIIVLGGSIGTGEWLMGPAVTVKFQGQMLWIATVAILLQSFLNTECIRYALYTGEPIFTGYLRTKPGPRFWAVIYALADAGMFLPAFVASIASLLVAGWLGVDRLPGPEDRYTIMWVGIVLSVLCFVLMLFGGKIYNMLLACMTGKVLWVLGFLLFVDLFLVPWDKWALLLRGFFFPFDQNGLMIPSNLTMKDWATIAGFAAFAGAGGLSNATFSNYAREKGWGMGSLVGSIPSAIGGLKIDLAPIGKVFSVTPEALERWKAWWKYVHFDQYVIWVIGCFAGMILPVAMSLQFVQPEASGQLQIASMQARGIADAFAAQGPGARMTFWYLTMFTGFLIVWFTQVQVLDHVSRRWTDIIWTGSGAAREASGNSVKRIYYGIASVYALMNCGMMVFITLMGGTPFTILVITAVSSGFAMVISAFHTFYVNRRFLPKELRPVWWREAGLLLCGAFYLIMTVLAVTGQFIK
jgi:Mn2+/Fe2+ NRAMP family transporter